MLEIRDLVKVYPGPVPALRGVELNLPQEFGFYPHLTGRDMLFHLLELKG